ncbi:MAG: type I-MYXAN CRISPR-associated protein Cmx8 [Dehalococcoidia bacterium]
MVDEISLCFDPLKLPSPHHRAGLAGLKLVVDQMRRTDSQDPPEAKVEDDGTVQVRFTARSLGALLDYLYEATEREIPKKNQSRGKGKGAISAVVEEGTIYDPEAKKEPAEEEYDRMIVPRAGFLRSMGMPDVWLRLWQDVMLAVIRAQPTTRKVYDIRYAGKPVGYGEELWKQLRPSSSKRGSSTALADLKGWLQLGAMEVNSDLVRFQDEWKHALLLHFWPVVLGLGVVWTVEMEDRNEVADDGERKKRKQPDRMYILAVPDVLDVDRFVKLFGRVVGELGDAKLKWWPRDAVLRLPEEAGLEYLRRLWAVSGPGVTGSSIARTVAGVDLYLLKANKGRTPVQLASARVSARPDLIERYASIHARFWNPLFRSQLVRNLLEERSWLAGFDRIFERTDPSLLRGSGPGSFGRDANRRLRDSGAETSEDGYDE